MDRLRDKNYASGSVLLVPKTLNYHRPLTAQENLRRLFFAKVGVSKLLNHYKATVLIKLAKYVVVPVAGLIIYDKICRT